jgi:hypothetical protein
VRGPTPAATARNIGRPLPPLHTRRRDLPAGLCDAIDAALDPWPERRPALGALRDALADSARLLPEDGGLDEPATIERFGLRPRERPRPFGRSRARFAAPPSPFGVGISLGHRFALLVGRLAAGTGAAGLVLAALGWPAADPPVEPAVAGPLAAAAVMVLPRLGWLACAALAVGWLATPAAGEQAAALVVAAALAPVPVLLPRAGVLWSVPALAPLLGLAGLGPAFVAVAGLAPTLPRRAGLAAAGFAWLAAAEAIGAEPLLFGAPLEVPPPGEWTASVGGAADALRPYVTSAALAPALVWAAFAALLPLAVRGRLLVADLALGSAWAVGLVVALEALGEALGGAVAHADPRGAIAGAALGLLAAVAVAGARGSAALPEDALER